MGTKYVTWNAAEIKRLVPTYSAPKLAEALIKQLARELKNDKKYAAEVDDATLTAAVLASVETEVTDLLRKLKAAPTALELYTDTGWLSGDSNLLLKMTCEGPLSGKAQKLNLDWKRIKGSLKLAGSVSGSKRLAAPKSWAVLSHPDLWSKIKPKLDKDLQELFDRRSLPVQVDLTDPDALEHLAANGSPLLAQKVKDKARWSEIVDALVKLFQTAGAELQADPSRQKTVVERLQKEVEGELLEGGRRAAEEILGLIKGTARRDAYALTSTLDLEPKGLDKKKSSGGGANLPIGASGVTALFKLYEALAKGVTALRTGLEARDKQRDAYLEAVDQITTRHTEARRKRTGGQEPSDPERAEGLLKAAGTHLEAADKALTAWQAANEALSDSSEQAYDTLERLWTQLEKCEKELEKLTKAVTASKSDLDAAIVKSSGELPEAYEELSDLLEPLFDDLDTALKRADADTRVLEEEARALKPLLASSPSWATLDGGIPDLGGKLSGLSADLQTSTRDRLERIERSVKKIKELKEDQEEVEEALAELKKKKK